MECLHVKISGIVQGVFFRSNTQQIASALGLTGWVKNCNDGSVEILAEGKKEKLEAFLEYCYRGPEGARVDKVDYKWLAAKGEFKDFKITHSDFI